MRTLADWLLTGLLLGYVWLFRNDMRVMFAGLSYFVVAGWLAVVVQQFRAKDLPEDAPLRKAESAARGLAFLFGVLAFLNSFILASPKVIPTAIAPAITWVTYSAFSVWGVQKIPNDEDGFRVLPPAFSFASLYIYVALLMPLLLFFGSRGAVDVFEFTSPPSLALLFAALCSGSLAASIWRFSALARLDHRTRIWGGAIVGGLLVSSGLLRALSGGSWYSYLLSTATVLALTVSMARLWDESRLPQS